MEDSCRRESREYSDHPRLFVCVSVSVCPQHNSETNDQNQNQNVNV